MLDTINSGLDVFMVFARSLMDVNNRVLRTVKSRTHFISCAYYCCLAVENDVSQDEINRTLTEFFSGHPSISPEYNHTVSAGSAKPASVQLLEDRQAGDVGTGQLNGAQRLAVVQPAEELPDLGFCHALIICDPRHVLYP